MSLYPRLGCFTPPVSCSDTLLRVGAATSLFFIFFFSCEGHHHVSARIGKPASSLEIRILAPGELSWSGGAVAESRTAQSVDQTLHICVIQGLEVLHHIWRLAILQPLPDFDVGA